MAQTKRLIFNVNGLEKSYGSYQALKIGKLRFTLEQSMVLLEL